MASFGSFADQFLDLAGLGERRDLPIDLVGVVAEREPAAQDLLERSLTLLDKTRQQRSRFGLSLRPKPVSDPSRGRFPRSNCWTRAWYGESMVTRSLVTAIALVLGIGVTVAAGFATGASGIAEDDERSPLVVRSSEGTILGALRRVNKKGKKVKHEVSEQTASRTTRTAGRAKSGTIVFFKAVVNEANVGADFRFVVRKKGGFRKAKISHTRARGLRCAKAKMRTVGGQKVWVVRCKVRPFAGRRSVVFGVGVPSTTKKGNLLAWLTSSNVVKEGAVAVAIGKKKPKKSDADEGANEPVVPPAPDTGGVATDADCPRLSWAVTTAFGPRTLVFLRSDMPSGSQLGCIYKDQAGGTTQFRIDIAWTGASTPVNRAGDCDNGPGPVQHTTPGLWESLNRQVEARFQTSVTVNSPDADTVMTDLVEALEVKGVGAACP
ncbi:MAG: hypothetical protein ACR2OD_00020 [Gaiellaceae bacterium]